MISTVDQRNYMGLLKTTQDRVKRLALTVFQMKIFCPLFSGLKLYLNVTTIHHIFYIVRLRRLSSVELKSISIR